MQPEVRQYQDKDEQALVRLWRQVLPCTAPHHDPSTSLKQKLAHDREGILVATMDDQIVGAVMGGFDGHRGWIYSLAVDVAHRRQGVGTALVQQMESLLRQRGCLKVNLQVHASTAEVIGFYEELGFEVQQIISMGKRLY